MRQYANSKKFRENYPLAEEKKNDRKSPDNEKLVNVSILEEGENVDEAQGNPNHQPQKKLSLEGEPSASCNLALPVKMMSALSKEMDITECKTYLIELAKSLYLHLQPGRLGVTKKTLEQVEMFGEFHAPLKYRQTRSLSDPLEYFLHSSAPLLPP